jgi:hypothetical protein
MIPLTVDAQTTSFNYQGRLTDGGNPANGSFQMQFKLFDALAGGTQIGSALTDVPVTASNGAFSARLDFGSAPLTGANRWLEIAVRRNSGESYVTLSPREQIASSPYAVRTVSAAMADDSQKLGGLDASNYVTPTNGGTSFIRNQNTQQPSSAFNISGNGTVGGNLVVGPNTSGAKFGVSSSTNNAGNNTAMFEAPSIGSNASHIHFGSTGDWYIRSATSTGKVVIQDTGGGVAIANTVPTAGYKLDVGGPIKSFGDTTHIVAQTTGGTNSWARFYARSNSQSWFLGTSQNFNGNQFYIADETFGATRLSIQPNNGPVSVFGNLSQPSTSKGLPKLILSINSAGTLTSCFDGRTGVACTGVTTSRLLTGTYRVNMGFLMTGPIIMIGVGQAGRFATSSNLSESATETSFDITVMNADGFLADGPVSAVIF